MTAYSFLMIGWDAQHEVRIFALTPLATDSLQRIIDFFGQTPEWPVWFPAELKAPTEEFRSRLDVLDGITKTAEQPAVIVAWSRSTRACVAARRPDPEVLEHIREWFTLEDQLLAYDWFAYLGLPTSDGVRCRPGSELGLWGSHHQEIPQ
jgi:hypothetical protein